MKRSMLFTILTCLLLCLLNGCKADNAEYGSDETTVFN